jgi:glycosyltransferase involved in cell wall biosynthesis
VGGGLQVALSFINELKRLDNNHEYFIFLSLAVEKQLDKQIFSEKFHFYTIKRSPSSLKTRKQIVKQLDDLEDDISPDVVFSIFGPSYWKPKATHIVGFADGWVYNPDSIAFDRLSILKRLKMRLQGKYKSYYLKKDTDYFVMETEDAKHKLSETMKIDKENIFVVGNTYSSIFDDRQFQNEQNNFYLKLDDQTEDEFRLMYIAHNHVNKNIKIINDILPLLEDNNIKFVLTLDEESYQTLFPHPTNKIINIGVIAQKSCPSVYEQCDALFSPTLLETFSAAYPEAMKMQKPILTSNYSFATDTCKDAALYFDPLDPKDIADKIKQLVKDKNLQTQLIEKGSERLKKFETARSRAEKYIEICEKIVNKSKGEKNV